MTIHYQKDIKYQLYRDESHKLNTDIKIDYSADFGWYGVEKDQNRIYARKGFAWDGATCFPDFSWILEGSLWHDVLHLLIAQGAIPTSENDKIDKELKYIIRSEGGKSPDNFMMKMRGSYVGRATNFVDQKVTQPRPVYELHKGRITRVK